MVIFTSAEFRIRADVIFRQGGGIDNFMESLLVHGWTYRQAIIYDVWVVGHLDRASDHWVRLSLSCLLSCIIFHANGRLLDWVPLRAAIQRNDGMRVPYIARALPRCLKCGTSRLLQFRQLGRLDDSLLLQSLDWRRFGCFFVFCLAARYVRLASLAIVLQFLHFNQRRWHCSYLPRLLVGILILFHIDFLDYNFIALIRSHLQLLIFVFLVAVLQRFHDPTHRSRPLVTRWIICRDGMCVVSRGYHHIGF